MNVQLLKSLVKRLKPLNFLTQDFCETFSDPMQGPLKGVTLVVKDNFCIKNHRTTCASFSLRNFIPSYTATVVQRLMDSGATVIGKTNMDEFGVGCNSNVSLFGSVRCPFNQKRSPGGSSGGSAVAVATGFAELALGSDTGGSVRLPAAHCGVYGFKPSYGRLSRYGLVSFADSMDVPGFLARSSALLRLALSCTEGPDGFDSTVISFSNNKYKFPTVIGLPDEYFSLCMDEGRRTALEDFRRALEAEGLVLKPVSLKHTRYALACYIVLTSCELMSNLTRYNQFRFGNNDCGDRGDCFYDLVKGRIVNGNYFLLEQNHKTFHESALRVRRLIKNDFERVFANVDLLLTPSTLSDPPLIDAPNPLFSDSDVVFVAANLSGNPAIAAPLPGKSSLGIPFSMQFIAPFGADKCLLDFLGGLESKGLVKCQSPDAL